MLQKIFSKAAKVAEGVKKHLEGLVEDINDITHSGEVEVTIYTTYGYMQDGEWVIPMRGRVHQKRELPDKVIARTVAESIGCVDPDLDLVVKRTQDFTDDSRSGQSVILTFESDPENEQYGFPLSDLNGLIELEIKLSVEKARGLLDAQGSSQWLSFNTVHGGSGRVRLIEPEGVSVISDIDDTIKVSMVPGDKDEVLRRTFCREFETVDGMARRYRQDWGEASFHYVSGGPWQLYRSLYNFLIEGEGGFPDGSFHMNYYPKNFLSEDTREILIDAIVGSLGRTFDHKVEQIKTLMTRFAGRSFILVGDSGEIDPEVYRHIKDLFPTQVREIWIRDVLNDEEVNPYRLEGMNMIKVDPAVCATIHHHEKLSVRLQERYGKPYIRNTAPPCA
jgi:phosphatidate phosphatase APP1